MDNKQFNSADFLSVFQPAETNSDEDDPPTNYGTVMRPISVVAPPFTRLATSRDVEFPIPGIRVRDPREDHAETPVLPSASPNINLNAPVVSMDGHSPSLVTPMIEMQRPQLNAPGLLQSMSGPAGSTNFCICNKRKGETCTFCWAWDLRSEKSAPSLWSASNASTAHRSRSGQPSGHYVIGGDVDACIEGQRLLYVRPQSLTTTGGKVYIELIRTIPQPLYGEIEVLLVAGKQGTVTLKPEAIKKGKKLCVVIPSGLAEEQDYDVRVKFAGKTLHGSFPLEIRAAESD